MEETVGAWAYLVAWDVHRARLFGLCASRYGIAPFDRLVDLVMSQEPYRSARRVFWVIDNGSAHRGAKGDCYQALAQPFHWTFTRADLHRLLAELTVVRPAA